MAGDLRKLAKNPQERGSNSELETLMLILRDHPVLRDRVVAQLRFAASRAKAREKRKRSA